MTLATLPLMERPRISRASGLPDAPGDWWTLRVLGNHERRMAAVLTVWDIGWYLPLREETKFYESKTVQAEVPLFPTYLFIRLQDTDDLDLIRKHDSCRGLCAVNDQKRLTRELTAVDMMVQTGNVRPYNLPVKGQRCRITGGPYRDSECIVVEDGAKQLYVVRLTEAGLSAAMRYPGIPPHLLEPI